MVFFLTLPTKNNLKPHLLKYFNSFRVTGCPKKRLKLTIPVKYYLKVVEKCPVKIVIYEYDMSAVCWFLLTECKPEMKSRYEVPISLN